MGSNDGSGVGVGNGSDVGSRDGKGVGSDVGSMVSDGSGVGVGVGAIPAYHRKGLSTGKVSEM
jgi:hypothetical protein